MATLLNGRLVSNFLLEKLKKEVEYLQANKVNPKLVVILIGEDPASQVYVKNKQKACEKIGLLSEKYIFPSSISQEELISQIEKLNTDESVNGMIVQLPLPAHIDSELVIKSISPEKDVDGFHAFNMGNTLLGKQFEYLSPCTPQGIIRILEHYEINPEGMNTLVIGRSNIVGKPVAMMMLNRNASVSICHSKTRDLESYTKNADILIVAIGRANFVKADMVKKGAIVIDVGINRLEDGSLCGDVDFENVESLASAITPVPGGIGPMTVACLLENTIKVSKTQNNL